VIDGRTRLIAHIGHPTHTFKSPLIYNPYFEAAGINAVVVPMDCAAVNFAQVLQAVFSLGNTIGTLITMPHKVAVVDLLAGASAAVRVAGACNAVRQTVDGRLVGDMFDGEGFVRALNCKGFKSAGQRALIIGAGGVGSAIAASLAGAGVRAIALFDTNPMKGSALANRLRSNYPRLPVTVGTPDPAGFDLVVNASPLGMNDDDPLPLDIARLSANCFVGEVVLKREATPLVAAARSLGCQTVVGTDVLFEQIPAYLEFFGLPTTTAANLRDLARLGDR
jgi:shikimate dehydrogenase